MLGIHAAMMAGIPAFMAKVAHIVCRRIYEKLSASPMPRYIPMPPLRFRALRLAPMMVRINEAKQEAMRLWYSTSYCTTLLEPRSYCLDIYLSSSGLVNVSCCPLLNTRSMGSIIISVSISLPLTTCSRMPFSVRIL